MKIENKRKEEERMNITEFERMLKVKRDFEEKLNLDRPLEAYGVIVDPDDVYKAIRDYTKEELSLLASWYKYRGQKHGNPAQIMVSVILKYKIQENGT